MCKVVLENGRGAHIEPKLGKRIQLLRFNSAGDKKDLVDIFNKVNSAFKTAKGNPLNAGALKFTPDTVHITEQRPNPVNRNLKQVIVDVERVQGF